MVGVAVGIALGRADLGLVDRFPSWLRQMLCCVCCVVLCLCCVVVGVVGGAVVGVVAVVDGGGVYDGGDAHWLM